MITATSRAAACHTAASRRRFDAQFGGAPARKSDRRFARRCLDLVRCSGMLTDPATRDAFLESGCVAEDGAS